ncbi:flavin reductase family protein [Streptomyces sp. NRRL F-5123]|uniref:flavin reductase family protein n=1 Tax=Streptomyces sp. NRRL F-5123 TaxID=1463856 RepID=UPI000A670A29|nr:flavin reductase family protein [Streptomyces sp. NRRL F-5123]
MPAAGTARPGGHLDPPGPTHQVFPVDGRSLRTVSGLFVTGVTVISTGDGEQGDGTTVNSFTSVSLDPPLILFCIHRDSRLRDELARTGRFAVNLLARRHEQLATTFAGRQVPASERVFSGRSRRGVPVLSESLAYMDCDIRAEYPGGDHVIVLGEVAELGVHRQRQEPLTFFEGSFGRLEEELRAAYARWDG